MARIASPPASPCSCPHHHGACPALGAARREWRHQGEVLLTMGRLRLIGEAAAELLLTDWQGGADFTCSEALFSLADDMRARIRCALIDHSRREAMAAQGIPPRRSTRGG